MDPYRLAKQNSRQPEQLVLAGVPGAGEERANSGQVPTSFDRLAAGNTAFAIDLYHRLRTAEGNLFFSPYSISTALAMTYAGARGATEAQMADVLHFDLPPAELHPAFAALEAHFGQLQRAGDIALHVANSLWPLTGYGFLQAYLDLCLRCYGVSITPVDYVRDAEAARRQINAWVEAKTLDKIKDLLQPRHVRPDTTLVLVNAIYFKGNWLNPFDPEETLDGGFRLPDGRSVTVSLMSQRARFGYGQADGVQILELPYVGEALSMLILLPKQVDGVTSLEETLTAETLAGWTAGLRDLNVDVTLPRFKLSGRFDLEDTLMAMGMVDAFSGQADFSGMTGARTLFISKVVHKAFVEVNEEGTEAAAATAVVMGRGVSQTPVFRADHPFLFLIRDRASGSILFLGRLMDPTAGE